jgi:chitosanase
VTRIRAALGALALVLVAPAAAAPPTAARTVHQPVTPTAAQRHVADELTSIFENGTPVLQYGYLVDLHDGRGYTAGRAGFCTATGDLLAVVERFVAARPRSPLARHLPRLRKLAATGSPSVAGLPGFPAAWRKAAKDRAMRAAQDAVVDREYYRPALGHVRRLGLRTPLAVAILDDSEVQHGDGTDPDGVPALIGRTIARVGGPGRVGEPAWLRTFLVVRRADLAHAYDPDTRAEWAESVQRADALGQIVRAGNFPLRLPLSIDVPAWQITLTS